MKTQLKKFAAFGVFVLALMSATLYNQKSNSANLTSVSVTLSESRPSFRGALTAVNTAGSSLITINSTVNAYPSTSSAQLAQGDAIAIGEAGSLGAYTVTATGSANQFTITPVLLAGDADNNDDVISTQAGSLTVRFTTANAIANGRFRVLVPALVTDTASGDGIPDGGMFDFGTAAPTVTCPTDVGATYDFVTGTATRSVTFNGLDYHTYECAYSGSGSIGAAFNAMTISNVINPAPATAHTGGIADRYNVIVQNVNSGFTVSDATTVSVGVIEAVRVSAVVAPQITFEIIGVAAGQSACGVTTSVTTTPLLVPFNELLISTFTNAAQFLTVSTNASNGYAVTAKENDQLSKQGIVCTGDALLATHPNCIQDSRGDDALMSHTNPDDWSLAATKGFGYSLDNLNNVSGLTPAFEYDGTQGSCGGGIDCYKQFADAEQPQTPVTIYSATAPADNHNVEVCYKAIIAPTQAAGLYENFLTYTATATF